ncbi:hypothetical protein C1645_804446 [Glomus cerebriforme]|uniref:Uncharacterized protein n=1 Tax=Glomus cerebriforme TaxID=658196 RepID=A0A397T926_9GLOM|nr:hypothetical protein C1645_804446 [Glomus cerebriforme]
MTNLSDIPDENKCKAIILDSLLKDKFITQAHQQPPQENDDFAGKAKRFLKSHKTALLTGTFAVAGLIAGPAIIGGAVAALGFGEAGIAAGSIAAWMMSLHRGYVAAGSLVAILQSVGAVGLGIGGVIASGLGGGLFAGAITKAVLKKLESKEELAELENFVSITATSEKIIFVIKRPILINDEILNSFLRGFDSVQKITKLKQFEFRVILDNEKCVEGSMNLRKYLEAKYEVDRVTEIKGGYLLNLNLRNN